LNRRPPSNIDDTALKRWNNDRNRQCNFDTVLQVISLRSQPEDITVPEKQDITFAEFQHFGFLFDSTEDKQVPKWAFDFTVNYYSVFDDGISELGALYTDCDSVPMLTKLNEWDKLPNFLDISPELKNIYFEVLHD